MRMIRIAPAVAATLATLIATLPLVSSAQNDPEGDIDQCRSLSAASRTRANACGGGSSNNSSEGEALSASQEFTITLERPAIELSQCQATLAIDYVQIRTVASVHGVIKNEDCGASGGEYTIEARIRDANGETQALEFDETWQRSDDQPVEFTSEYPIGENVELVRVRSRKLRCECTEE